MKNGLFISRLLIITLLAVFALASCTPKKIIRSTPGSSKPAAQSGLPGYKSADPDKALDKYTKHLSSTKPGDPGRNKAWQQTVNSAVQLGEYDLAEKNLRNWQAENGTAPKSWDWNQANSQLLLATKGQDAYSKYLTNLIGRTDLDWSTREAAGMDLFAHFWDLLEYGLAFDSLGLLYKAAPDKDTKAPLESYALSRAETLSKAEMDKTIKASMGADPATFPWSMLIWAQGMQQLKEDKANWAKVYPSLSSIVRSGNLANQSFFAGNLRALEKEMGGAISQNVVLLLPLSGPYSKVGWQIAKGADCAWRETKLGAAASQVKLINTESAAFMDDLRKVEAGSIVGGPLRKELWEQIRLAGLQRDVRFMTFLPSVENEGSEAWRFFSSPSDQVRSVMQAATKIGVTSFAVLNPQDRFGTGMATIFGEEAKNLSLPVVTTRSYDINNPPVWTQVVGDLLGAKRSGKDAVNNPEPPFQAVFLPDSLSRIQQLAPLFHYYEEDRLIFLGPQLWSQSIGEARLEMQYFGLTIFPGTWDPNAPSQAVTNLKKGMVESSAGDADLWAALGYDFARFTALIGNTTDAASFSQAVAQASTRMSWSMAPIRWDASGRASQEMFIFQPTASGMVAADYATIQRTREERKIRREERKLLVQPKKQ